VKVFVIQTLLFLLSCGPSPEAVPQDLSTTSLSATRDPGESFADAEERFRASLSDSDWASYKSLHSAKSLAQPYDADTVSLSSWSENELEAGFSLIRDQRFLSDEQGLQRRLTWLYPDDGCYARADLMVRNLASLSYEPPQKLFAFGELAVKTDNALGGEVRWWYHVAPVVAVDGESWVIDPAVDSESALLLDDWVNAITTQPDELKISLCSSHTYGPISRCLSPDNPGSERALADLRSFLDKERDRLEALDRDANAELGDAPPWAE